MRRDSPVNALLELDDPAAARWWKKGPLETHALVVTEKATDRMSIRLATPEGIDRGWCPCWSAYGTVKVGDVVTVGCRGLTARGKLWQARMTA